MTIRALLVLVVACGATEGDTVDRTTACEEWARSYCARAIDCEDPNPNRAGCEGAYVSLCCEGGRCLEGVITLADIAACTMAVDAAQCAVDDFFGGTKRPNQPDECDWIWP